MKTRLTTAALVAVAGTLLLVSASSAVSAEAAPAEDTATVEGWDRAAVAPRADGVRLEKIYQETGAEKHLPPPSWREYLGLLAEVFAEWLSAKLGALLPRGTVAPRVVAGIIMGVIALALIAIVARWISWRRSPRIGGDASAVVIDRKAARGKLPVERSTEEWEAEVEACLARADVCSALEAVFWWFARSVLRKNVDPCWTSREVLVEARREDLRPQAALLDCMMYGPKPPSPGEVRALVGRMQEVLP